MRGYIKNEIECLLTKQPLLSVEWNEDGAKITGNYKIHCEFNKEIYSDCFGVEIRVSYEFPNEIPIVRGTDYRIRAANDVRGSNYRGHVYTDGSFCLELETAIRIELDKNPSLLFYLANYLDPYLFGFLFFQRHNKMPFGERAHGNDGVLSYYCELFSVNDVRQADRLLRVLVNNNYNGHRSCLCESGKRYRDCHRQKVSEMRNSKYFNLYFADYRANEEARKIT